ncbi:MAG: lamin tail domain-containing protein [Nanoarchaeota archaeon]
MLFFLLFLSNSSIALEINEIMYNPSQKLGGNYNEWVELFNSGNESIDLTNWKINGKNFDDVNIAPAEYVVIAEKLLGNGSFEALYGNNDSIWNKSGDSDENYTAVDATSFSLDDDAGMVNLSNGSMSIIANYSKGAGGNGNNKTLERREDNSWGESTAEKGTPGRQNSIWIIPKEPENKSENKSENDSLDYSYLKINEIMPDPFGDDDAKKTLGEWVELYNSGKKEIELKELVLKDSKDDGKLPIADNKVMDGTVICSGCYKVIYRDGDSDFSLNQDYDEVRLFADDKLIDEISYSGSTEGMSLSKINDQWFQTMPTPGSANVYVENCDWKMSIALEKNVFNGDEDFAFDIFAERLLGFTENITVRGKIEDLFGKTVSDYSPWTNYQTATSAHKSYSPNLKDGVYSLSFWFENLTCNDSNPADNKALALVAINPRDKTTNSSLAIEKIYLGNDEVVKWGDQFTAQVNIYKGKESKYSVQLWAEKDNEKISKSTKFNIYEEYSNYTFTLPVQLIPNCNEKISDGQAKLVLEGLGLQAEQTFSVKGINDDTCKNITTSAEKKTSSSAKSTKEKNVPYQIVELPSSAVPNGVFRLKVQLLGDDSAHSYKIWSYLYRGSKCYSCSEETVERESNLQEVKLKKNELKTVEFLIKVDDVKEGEYKLKVKLNKDNQKTDKELTSSIYVKSESSESKNNSLLGTSTFSENMLASDSEGQEDLSSSLSAKKEKIAENKDNKGVVIYESSSDKAKRKTLYLLLISFVLLIVVLILKK